MHPPDDLSVGETLTLQKITASGAAGQGNPLWKMRRSILKIASQGLYSVCRHVRLWR